jgi:hypothetical protein
VVDYLQLQSTPSGCTLRWALFWLLVGRLVVWLKFPDLSIAFWKPKFAASLRFVDSMISLLKSSRHASSPFSNAEKLKPRRKLGESGWNIKCMTKCAQQITKSMLLFIRVCVCVLQVLSVLTAGTTSNWTAKRGRGTWSSMFRRRSADLRARGGCWQLGRSRVRLAPTEGTALRARKC